MEKKKMMVEEKKNKESPNEKKKKEKNLWTKDMTRWMTDGFKGSFISSRRPLIYVECRI
jgi:hypothetical protein